MGGEVLTTQFSDAGRGPEVDRRAPAKVQGERASASVAAATYASEARVQTPYAALAAPANVRPAAPRAAVARSEFEKNLHVAAHLPMALGPNEGPTGPWTRQAPRRRAERRCCPSAADLAPVRLGSGGPATAPSPLGVGRTPALPELAGPWIEACH